MDVYVAKGIFRNGHTNSILAGSPARKLVVNRVSKQFQKQAQYKVIPARNNIRLSAYYNIQSQKNAATVVLLHGWLGCSNSLYILTLGDYLYKHGFNVIRINLRDHGDSHGLNEKLFHSCRIQEVINACKFIQSEFNVALSLIGFSLGANFALRVNAFSTSQELTLNQTIAFCPVIDPSSTLYALEKTFLVYRNYFMQRWKSAFYKKVDAFPHIYDKQTFDECKSLREATENLATKHAGFQTLESYLDGYSIRGNRLSTLQSNAKLVLAKDDPIIPWQDKEKLYASSYLDLLLTNHGGHCGYLQSDLTTPWINQYSLFQLNNC